ncbi:unnamed protein product, partial [Prunus brigantina]
IVCGHQHKRVIVLDLSGGSRNFHSEAEIGSLSMLQVLNLRKNNLVGEIPPSFGNPSSILRLSLDQNNLHGGYLSKYQLLDWNYPSSTTTLQSHFSVHDQFNII